MEQVNSFTGTGVGILNDTGLLQPCFDTISTITQTLTLLESRACDRNDVFRQTMQ